MDRAAAALPACIAGTISGKPFSTGQTSSENFLFIDRNIMGNKAFVLAQVVKIITMSTKRLARRILSAPETMIVAC